MFFMSGWNSGRILSVKETAVLADVKEKTIRHEMSASVVRPLHKTKKRVGLGPRAVFYFSLVSGLRVELTKADLIEDWAAQHGSAHEDWEFTEPFATAMKPILIAFGLPQHAHELRATAKAVIHVAETFLAQLTPERIAEVARQVPDAGDPRGSKGNERR